MDSQPQHNPYIGPSQPPPVDFEAVRRMFMHSLRAAAELPEEIDPVFVHQAQLSQTIFRTIQEFQMGEPISYDEPTETPNIHAIVQRVADATCVSMDQLLSRTRRQKVMNSRQVAMYLCRRLHPEVSYPRLGEYFGLDHSTVIHNCQVVEKRVAKYVEYRLYIEKLERQITGRAKN